MHHYTRNMRTICDIFVCKWGEKIRKYMGHIVNPPTKIERKVCGEGGGVGWGLLKQKIGFKSEKIPDDVWKNVLNGQNYFFSLQVKLVNISNDDIVDGNPKLTLGLLWSIILHWEVSRMQYYHNNIPIFHSISIPLFQYYKLHIYDTQMINLLKWSVQRQKLKKKHKKVWVLKYFKGLLKYACTTDSWRYQAIQLYSNRVGLYQINLFVTGLQLWLQVRNLGIEKQDDLHRNWLSAT